MRKAAGGSGIIETQREAAGVGACARVWLGGACGEAKAGWRVEWVESEGACGV